MTHIAHNYATILYNLEVDEDVVQAAKNIFLQNEELVQSLCDPLVSFHEKENVIDRIFDEKIASFLKVLCKDEKINEISNIFDAYAQIAAASTDVLTATVTCVEPPNEEQAEKIKQFLCKRFSAPAVELKIIEDESLIGGFTIQCNDILFDRSMKSKLSDLQQDMTEKAIESVNSDKIISILREEIENYNFNKNDEESGTVFSVGDGIAVLNGLNNVMYGEIIVFDTGIKGMVQDIRENQVGCILFGGDREVHAGSIAIRTHKQAGVPVGDSFIGRIVNSLGEPIDGKGKIKETAYRPIEQPAPSIVDRKPVDTPLATGILAIDAMFPIGRGQRELIIGDRQTGKTSIAIDTIINQKEKDVICIYNAIGQKASTVSQIVNTLDRHGAMDYTIVVCSTASDPASLQYISPYAATAMAEYFMYQGKDCLIVYDDLSKHAVAYRALSLLLQRSPGREAYPGDVFYLHSRLLERSSHLNDSLGGGSITALPIIETQAGDVSAYIPTNVISITDGQIFLESDLFFSGVRPAVNVGLSVSRVGGAAQTKIMKKAAGSLRIDLAQYREMEVFTQFASDLDDETKKNLNYGKCLMELLKQPTYHPFSLSDMIVSLVAFISKKFVDIPAQDIKDFQAEFLEFFNTKYADVVTQIEARHEMADEIKDAILTAADEYKRVHNG